jgi:hypothetical protein
MRKKFSTITEREVAADLAAELDKMIQQGGTPFDKATVEHHAGSLYPDITIWTDYLLRRAFAFWELKAPGRWGDLSKLPAKAQILNSSRNSRDGRLVDELESYGGCGDGVSGAEGRAVGVGPAP